MLAARTTNGTVFQLAKRFLSTSSCLCERKSRIPFDKRFPVFPDDVAPGKPGGSEEMMKLLPEEIRAPTGIYHKVTKEFIHVPEMVPEFVVPDLTGFELKPYVSYKAKEIIQNPLTPQDIFNTVYARDFEDAFRAGELQVKDGQIICKDGQVLNIDQYAAELLAPGRLETHEPGGGVVPPHSTKPGMNCRDHVLPMHHDPSLGLPSLLQGKGNTNISGTRPAAGSAKQFRLSELPS